MKMSAETDEDRWRRALAQIGADEVRAMLARHPGRQNDRIVDLPLMPPYPTRAYCLEWCDEMDEHWYRPYTRMIITLALIGVATACYASCTLSSLLTTSNNQMSSVANLGVPSTMFQPQTGQNTTTTATLHGN